MKRLLLLLLSIASCAGATPFTPRVFTNYVDMAAKANASNYAGAIYILGGTNINDGYGGWFYPTHSVSGTNTSDKIADVLASGWSWQRLSLNTNITSSSSVYVGGSLLANPNFTDSSTALVRASSTNVSVYPTNLTGAHIASGSKTGTGSVVLNQSPNIDGATTDAVQLGSGTSFTINPAFDVFVGTVTGNATLNLGTTSVTAGVPFLHSKAVYLYDGVGGRTVTLSSSGTGGTAFSGGDKVFGFGTNSVTPGTNVYFIDWDGFNFHFDQNTAQISLSQLGDGTRTSGTLALTSDLEPSFVTLTDGATITGTCDSKKASQNWTVTLGGARTLAISGATSGMTGVLIVKQDGTGSRTLALPASSKVTGGGSGAITLTSTASAIDILTWVYDGTNYYWTYGKNFN